MMWCQNIGDVPSAGPVGDTPGCLWPETGSGDVAPGSNAGLVVRLQLCMGLCSASVPVDTTRI